MPAGESDKEKADRQTRAAIRQGKAIGRFKGAMFAYVRVHDRDGSAEEQAVNAVRAAVRLVHALGINREVSAGSGADPLDPSWACECDYCKESK